MNSIEEPIVDEDANMVDGASTSTTTSTTSIITKNVNTEKGGQLKYAVESDDFETVKRLVEIEQISPNQKDTFGDLPLHGGIVKGRVKIVKYLLEKGADPNLPNSVGSTALHKLVTVSTLRDQFDLIELLMKAGADATIKNGAGLLPEQLSTFSKIKEVLQGDQAVTIKVHVPYSEHSKVIGKGGRNVKLLREVTNTSITIPELKDQDPRIIIKGRKDDVESARTRILELLAPPKPKEEPFAGDTIMTLPTVPKDKHRLLIGAGGSTIKRLRDEYNVKITIPPQDNANSTIIIQGDSEDVDNVMKEINKILAKNKQKNQQNNINSPLFGSGPLDHINNTGGNHNNNNTHRNNNNNNNKPRQPTKPKESKEKQPKENPKESTEPKVPTEPIV